MSHTLAPVLTLSKAPLRDLTSYRKMVEPPAASLAATLASAEEKDALLKLAAHNPGPGYGNEVAFHERIAELSENLLLRVLVMVPHDLLREHLKGEEIDDAVVDEANQAHVAVAKAIASGDGDRAARDVPTPGGVRAAHGPGRAPRPADRPARAVAPRLYARPLVCHAVRLTSAAV